MRRNFQRGSTGKLSKHVLFLHSAAGHPLPLNLIETIFASNWSLHYELHEDVLGFMWVTLCANWQGFELTMTTKILTGWFCMGKQHVLAYIPNYLAISLHLFCNDICLLQGLHTTKNHVIWNGGWPAVKILWWKVGFTLWALRRMRQNWLVSSSGVISYLWVLSLEIANSSAKTLATYLKYPCLGPQMTISEIFPLSCFM